MVSKSTLAACVVVAAMFGSLLTLLPLAAQDKGKEPPKEKQAAKAEPAIPDESKLYVWGQPNKGTQSLLLLRAIDGDRVEAAFLVPVVVHLQYKNGKATAEQIEAVGGGRLLPFDLRGNDRFGRLIGDAYLGKEDGWLTESAQKAKLKKDDEKPKDKNEKKDK